MLLPGNLGIAPEQLHDGRPKIKFGTMNDQLFNAPHFAHHSRPIAEESIRVCFRKAASQRLRLMCTTALVRSSGGVSSDGRINDLSSTDCVDNLGAQYVLRPKGRISVQNYEICNLSDFN